MDSLFDFQEIHEILQGLHEKNKLQWQITEKFITKFLFDFITVHLCKN